MFVSEEDILISSLKFTTRNYSKCKGLTYYVVTNRTKTYIGVRDNKKYTYLSVIGRRLVNPSTPKVALAILLLN